MRTQRAGDARERVTFTAAAGVACEVRRAIGDRVVTTLGDPSPLGAPREQLFTNVAQLRTQVARRAASAAGRAGPALAVLVQVVADRQQQALGIRRDVGATHACSVARQLSRESRTS